VLHVPAGVVAAAVLAAVERLLHQVEGEAVADGVADLLFNGPILGEQDGVVLGGDGQLLARGEDAEHARQPRHAQVVGRVVPRAGTSSRKPRMSRLTTMNRSPEWAACSAASSFVPCHSIGLPSGLLPRSQCRTTTRSRTPALSACSTT